VLVPLALVAFVALARGHARTLTLAFVAANLLVLVPVRTPVLAVAMAGVALLALLKLEIVKFSRSTELDTLEGELARAMPFFRASVLGVVFIVGSAYVERHRARIARLWERLSPAAPERHEA
jgi:hypothetical protein